MAQGGAGAGREQQEFGGELLALRYLSLGFTSGAEFRFEALKPPQSSGTLPV